VTSKEVYQPHKAEPRFFYGYIVVVFAFIIMVVSWGPYSVFGVFFNPLLDEFHWTRAMTSGAFSLSMVLHGVLGIVMGGFTDRFGPRIVVTLCGVLLGAGYLLMSQVSTVWQLYLFYGVLIGTGVSGVWIPLLSTVARWFVKRRSLMTGIVVAGLGAGGFIAPPVISRLIAAYDWRMSYAMQGIVIIVVMILGAQFLRRNPAQMGQLPYGEDLEKQPGLKSATSDFSFKEAACTAQFWLFFVMLFCLGFNAFAVMVHIIPHAIELGISAVSAANILASLNGLSVLGNFVLGGLIGDRIGNRKVFIIGFIMMSAALFWLVPAEEVWLLYLCAAAFGCSLGGMGTSESPLVAGLFGLSSHGLIFGVVGLGFTGGAALGPLVTGYIFDLTGSYKVAFQICAALGVIGLIVSAVLRPTKKMGAKI
jgi:MFS family permease